MVSIDEYAREMALEKFALPLCLHVPIAARCENAIKRFIGNIVEVLVPDEPNKALLIKPFSPVGRNAKLPIWDIPEAEVLHYPQQVWVHVDYTGYRQAYIKAFSNQDFKDLVLDHVMNRRVARLKRFDYLRIVPISRAANSSSGGLSEKWAANYHSNPIMRSVNMNSPAQIQYADLSDIVKMLNLKTGGMLQDPVNEAQQLLKER